MRICQLTKESFTKMNGHAVVVNQWAEEFTKLGHEVVTVARFRKKAVLPLFDGVAQSFVGYKYSKIEWLELRRMRRALAELYAKWPFDILYCSSIFPAGFAALEFSAEKKIPLVVSSHGEDIADDDAGESMFQCDPKVGVKISEVLRSADAIIAISPYIQERQLVFASDCAKKIHQIPNGVDAAVYSRKVSLPRNDWEIVSKNPFVLFLGRLHQRKGARFLIDAFREIATGFPELQLVIAGTGEDQEALQHQAQQSGVASRIHFVGMVLGDEKLWLLQNNICVAIPTTSWEGHPLVALEALACGRPVIGTNVGGITSLIDAGVEGFLVTPSDKTALAKAFKDLLSDAALQKQMSESARQRASRYDWVELARRHLSLFEKLIAEKQPTEL